MNYIIRKLRQVYVDGFEIVDENEEEYIMVCQL